MKKKNKIGFVSEDQRKKLINEVIGFFQNERDEDIGYIAAEEILDFFLHKLGGEVYRKALKDSNKLLKEKMEDLEIELDVLTPEK